MLTVLQAAAQGTIEGVITDRATGDPVVGATVVVKGTVRGAACDVRGHYRIAGLDAGSYDLDVTMLTYAPLLIEQVQVPVGGTVAADAALEVQSEQLEEVVVTAVRRRDSEAAVNFDVRHAMMVVSGVSSQTIARTQDRDAGEVVRRIPGISLIDDRFVIARGLSQRYNNVWINGAAVPSSEADSRAFSFDLIPAGQIEQVMILKSPSPEVPADFTGGFIRIGTRDMPAENAVSIYYSLGIHTETHFRRFRYNGGGGTDWLGFDCGRRGLSGGIGAPFDNNDPEYVTRMTREEFNNDWRVRSRRPFPDQRLSASFGKAWPLRDGSRFTLNGAAHYSYAFRTYAGMENSRYGVYNNREDKPEYLYNYTDDQYQTTVKAGALLNAAYIGARSRYHVRNLVNQIGQNRYTDREGWQNVSSLYRQQKAEYLYTSRTTYNGQVAGSHDLPAGRLDWNAGYSYANRHVPDRRIINRQENDLHGDPHYGQMGIDQNEIRRDFTRLREHIASAAIDYELLMRDQRRFAPTLRVGAYGEYRARDYRARAFFYRFDAGNLPADFVYGDVVGEILQPGNYGTDKLYLYDDSNNRDCYDGENLLAAAYAAVLLPLGPVTVYAGVRVEHSAMDLTSYTRSKEWTSKVTRYDYTDLFPSVNMTWKLSAAHQLRAAYGRSTNRPEFREVSSSTFYDFDLFSIIMGNPDLKAAYIHNADLRYEWYPSPAESLSLAIFYKHFRHPIETTFRDAGGSYTYTFENADRAEVYGVELDVRKNLGFMGLPAFSLSLNASWIHSGVRFGEGSLEHDRPMQGQSPYIVNCGLFYQSERAGLTVSLLYNRNGKRIVGIGRADLSGGGTVDNDIPDMYEMPRDGLDVAVTKKLGRWELRFSARDVLVQSVRFCQFPRYTDEGGRMHERTEITKRFRPGCTLSLGAGVRF